MYLMQEKAMPSENNLYILIYKLFWVRFTFTCGTANLHVKKWWNSVISPKTAQKCRLLPQRAVANWHLTEWLVRKSMSPLPPLPFDTIVETTHHIRAERRGEGASLYDVHSIFRIFWPPSPSTERGVLSVARFCYVFPCELRGHA